MEKISGYLEIGTPTPSLMRDSCYLRSQSTHHAAVTDAAVGCWRQNWGPFLCLQNSWGDKLSPVSPSSPEEGLCKKVSIFHSLRQVCVDREGHLHFGQAVRGVGGGVGGRKDLHQTVGVRLMSVLETSVAWEGQLKLWLAGGRWVGHSHQFRCRALSAGGTRWAGEETGIRWLVLREAWGRLGHWRLPACLSSRVSTSYVSPWV